MGNAVSDESDGGHEPESVKCNAALYDFIEDECPIVNKAILSDNQRFRDAVLNEFNKELANQHFDSISDVINYMESKRMERIEFLKSISEERFSKTPAVKFPCIAIRINDKIATSFLDTGSETSCLTHRAAIKLGLDSCIITDFKGLATGFGNHSNIIGIVPNVVTQIGEMLFHINFVAVEKASADFIILGADFIVENKLKLDFRKGDVVFPRRVVEEKTVRFIPAIKNEKFATELLIRMVQNMNVPRIFDIMPDVVNEHIFLNVRINNIPVQVMIDSGAETSMITRVAAKHLKLFKFADLRANRVAHGLGPVVIIGQIPPIPVEFDETTTLFMPFAVLNGTERQMLILGSDFLTYYGCQIDFVKNHLQISLDSPRSYKLCEYKASNTSNMPNILKDCGLGSLLGLGKQEKTSEQPTRSPNENSSNSDEAIVTPKIFKTKNKEKETSPKKTTKDEYVTVSLDSLPVVTLSL